MPKAGVTHDIVIEDYDARNARGFMLMRDRQGRRPFITAEAEPIARRQLTMGELTHAEDPPTIALTWFQDTWIKGIGGQDWRNAEDRGKLQSAKKIETYPYGTLRPARELRSATLSAVPNTYSPSGFAVAPNDATPGTGGIITELWAFVGRDVYSGGDDNWTLEAEPQNLDVFYRNAINFDKWAVAPAWYGGTDVDEVAMPYIVKAPTSADWIASTLTAGRFKYFGVAKNAGGSDILWGANHVFNTGLTVSGAHNGTTTTLVCSANPTGTIAVNDMILVGAAGGQEVMLVTAVTNPNLTVVRGYGDTAQSFAGGESIYLYQPHIIKSSSDPTNAGSWSSATAIGADDSPITGLAVDEDSDSLLIAKTDGIWQQYYEPLREGGRLLVRNLTIEFRGAGHTGNFVGIHRFSKHHVMLPLGEGGLIDFDPSTGVARDISFRLTAEETTALQGVVLAMASNRESLFLALKDNSSELIHLVAGHLVDVDGSTDWRWEMLGEVGAGAAITNSRTGLWFDATKNDHYRIWLGFTESAVNETPRFLPVGTADQTDGYTNDTDCQAIMVRYDGNLPRVPKHFSEMEVESKNLGAGGRQWRFRHRLDGETTWTEWSAANVSPFQTIPFPAGLNGKVLEIEAVPSMTAVGTTPPEIVSVRLKSQVHPNPTKVFPVSVYLADNQALLNGVEGGLVNGDLKRLRTWNAGATDVNLYTPDKADARAVIFIPGSMKEQELGKEHGRRAEYKVSFLLAEV